MISEGPCDTKDWSNDTENSALITGINYILKYIDIKKQLFQIGIIFHNITVFTVFFSEIKCIQKHYKILPTPKF